LTCVPFPTTSFVLVTRQHISTCNQDLKEAALLSAADMRNSSFYVACHHTTPMQKCEVIVLPP